MLEYGSVIQELRRTLGKMEVALGTVRDCIVWTDQSGTIQWCNFPFDQLVGRPHIYVLAKNLIELLPLEEAGRSLPRQAHPVARALAGHGLAQESYVFHRDDRQWDLEISKSSISTTPQQISHVFLIQDITERKQAAEKQLQLSKHLESANKELTDFAFVVSHDLKAPLRAIASLANWISSDYADKLGEAGKEQLHLLLGRIQRMHNLIEGILRYSRIGRMQEERAAIDLNKLMTEVIETLAPPKHVQVTVEKLPPILCDRARMFQVFQNLIGNAIKFMDKPHGHVKVGCYEDAAYWKFYVLDNGPGIEERYHEKIFQIFQTIRPRDEFESTGVGLAIVKKSVELHGGRIWVESTMGRGTTFYFALPKQRIVNPTIQGDRK